MCRLRHKSRRFLNCYSMFLMGYCCRLKVCSVGKHKGELRLHFVSSARKKKEKKVHALFARTEIRAIRCPKCKSDSFLFYLALSLFYLRFRVRQETTQGNMLRSLSTSLEISALFEAVFQADASLLFYTHMDNTSRPWYFLP